MTDLTAVDPATETIDGVTPNPDRGTSVRDDILAAMQDETGEEEQAESRESSSEAETDEEEARASDDDSDDDADDESEDDSDDEPEPVEAPHSWNAADKEEFAKLPREAQEIIARRERERDEGINKTLEEVRPLKEVARKYDNYLRQLNTTPEAAFDYLMQAEYTLRAGTAAQKHAALEQIARDYGISLAQQSRPSGEDQPQVDPQVAALQRELAEFRSSVTSRQQAEEQQSLAQMEQKITEFREAKTEAGALAHPYFADVETDMVALAAADRAAGRTPDLADLYERAVWQKSETREKLLAEQKAAEQRKAAEEKKQRAARAKKASKSVSTAPSGNGGARETQKTESVRDSILAAMREASAA